MNQILIKIILICFAVGLVEKISGEMFLGLSFEKPSECNRTEIGNWEQLIGCSNETSDGLKALYKEYNETGCLDTDEYALKNCISTDFEKFHKYNCIIEQIRQDCATDKAIDKEHDMEETESSITQADLEASQKAAMNPKCLNLMNQLNQKAKDDLGERCQASLRFFFVPFFVFILHFIVKHGLLENSIQSAIKRCSNPVDPRYKRQFDTATELKMIYHNQMVKCMKV